MSDLAIFPSPLETEPSVLEDMRAVYRATEVSLGITEFGEIVAEPPSSSNRCIQQVMRILLSDKGSVPSEPGYGSTLKRLRDGYDPGTIMEDVILILLDVENQCKSKDLLGNTPLNAQLKSIELLDLDLFTTNELKLSIGVTTVSDIAKSFDVII